MTAAGASSRFGGAHPKVLAPLLGKPVLRHALDAFLRVDATWSIVVTAPPGWEEAIAAVVPEAQVVRGGATRQESVRCGVHALPPEAELVFVHDAARPFVTRALVERVWLAAREAGAALPVVAPTDTLHRLSAAGGRTAAPRRVAEPLDRASVGCAQTPQAARREWLAMALDSAARAGRTFTDEATLLWWVGIPAVAVEGEPTNRKITWAEDLSVQSSPTPA